MTSNAGSNLNNNTIGFSDSSKSMINKDKIIRALRDLFRPEFLNRVDEIIPFDSLNEEELLQIIDLLLKQTEAALSSKEIKLDVSEKSKKFILSKGTDLKYGARPLRRAIQKYIEDAIADMILRNEVQFGQTVYVDFANDNLIFSAS